ncbi:ribbon-helix-helix protein, CopG family [Streptomyces sp. NPDC006175]|uniref:ribbon-helix-helix protein, CopG family n=1 Tax=Streptomyces sp. NPDC006175 TaxID=3154471 RepID=UPI0033B9E5E2
MRITVNLPQEDIDFLDAYAAAAGLPSRSAVLHVAIGLLRAADQEADRRAQ